MMRAPFKLLRGRLTYANVVATLSAFLVLSGGLAYAANQLAKNSVGAKQLKAKSVTTAKIKKNAVGSAKIKKNAVSSTKVKGGSLNDSDLDPAAPFQKVVAELRTGAAFTVPIGGPGNFDLYPLDPSTYVQEAGRTDTYAAALDFTVAPTCVDRRLSAALLIDDPTPTEVTMIDVARFAASGTFQEDGNAPVSKRLNLGPVPGGGVSFAPSAPVTHTFTLVIGGNCEAGDGIAVTSASIDVIGIK